MSSLQTEPNALVLVRASLAKSLPDSQFSEFRVENGHPILVLQANQLLAGFGFGESEDDFDRLYGEFKKNFTQNAKIWSSLDVSFTFCPQVRPSEQFCSRIEADVYFCRKFVVILNKDIEISLLRLPFLPLAPLTGLPLRPPSAQTLLKSCSVPAELARFLVVQNARSAGGILNDCLANKFSSSVVPAVGQVVTENRQDRAQIPVKLKSLTITNFRAYRSSETFALGSAITVLYGPNGFGKTSFFDALDFAVTGGIGRLISALTDQAPLKAARHLDSKAEPCEVALAFARGEETHTIVRNLSDPTRARLDSKPGVSRKEILSALTGGEGQIADRVENLVALFRATHLFSQERQELTQDFQTSSELSSDLVSRMLAFEDYVSGIKKTNEVQSLIKNAIDRFDKDIARLQESAEQDRVELTRLEALTSAIQNPEVINAEGALLKVELSKTGIDTDNTPLNVATLRSSRAQLESRISELNSRGSSLSKAVGDLASARNIANLSLDAQRRVEETQKSIAEIDATRLLQEESIRKAIQNLSAAQIAESEVQRRHSSLSWRDAMAPEHRRLSRLKAELAAQFETANRQGRAIRQNLEAAENARRARDVALAEIDGRIADSTGRLRSLQALNGQRLSFNITTARLAEVATLEQACSEVVNDHRSIVEQATQGLASARAEVSRLEAEVSRIDAESSEVKALLAALRGHVTDGVCLLCGADHRSRDALLSRIDEQLQQDRRAIDMHEHLIVGRREVTLKVEELARCVEQLDEDFSRQATLHRERLSLQQALSVMVEQGSALGVTLSGTGWPEEFMRSAIDEQERRQITAIGRREEELRARDEAAQLFENLSAAILSNVDLERRTSADLKNVEESIALIASDPRSGGTAFDFDERTLEGESAQSEEDLLAAKAATAESQMLVDRLRIEIEHANDKASALKSILYNDQLQQSSFASAASAVRESLSPLGLTSETDDEALSKMISENTARVGHYILLRDRAANLEAAIDAVTTAAALNQRRIELRQREISIETAKSDRNRHEPWTRYFDAVSKLLRNNQNAATDEFTSQYGPRTAVIQRRLRPVYGFGAIDVSSKAGTISVRVARNGEALKPIDYFSQSQIQTLILGLFLTACSSQTWSTFSSIMMDDPVTHFDDLNTYALLDLIAGLLYSDEGSRQFVISTCDEKLFQLARRKFRHFQDSARFYRFSAIGANGPVVDEVPV